MIPLNDDGMPQFTIDPTVDYDGKARFEIPQAGEGPHVLFYAKAQHQGRESLQEGRPIHKSVLYVLVRHAGERDTIDRQATVEDCRRWPQQYAAFRDRRTSDARYQGTPLEILFPAHPDTVEVLRFHRVYTVEQLAKLTDTAKQNIGMGGVEWSDKAQRYLAATAAGKGFAYLEEANVGLQHRLERSENSNKLLQMELAHLKKQLDQLLLQQQQQMAYGPMGGIMPGGLQQMQTPMHAPAMIERTPIADIPPSRDVDPDAELRGAEAYTPARPPDLDGAEPNLDLMAEAPKIPEALNPKPPAPPSAGRKKGSN